MTEISFKLISETPIRLLTSLARAWSCSGITESTAGGGLEGAKSSLDRIFILFYGLVQTATISGKKAYHQVD